MCTTNKIHRRDGTAVATVDNASLTHRLLLLKGVPLATMLFPLTRNPVVAPPRIGDRLARPALARPLLLLLWFAVYGLSLISPPLLDDADATHAQAAQAMLRTGDWVTLHVNGIRYLEKPPLPYWLAAISLRLFGNNGFAVHLPLALTILALALLAWDWGKQAFGEPVAFYAGLFTLTATGSFLFTRVFIPDALLSLLLAITLFAALRALAPDERKPAPWAYLAWLALAAAILTKGLVALVFVFGTLALYLPLTGETHLWRRLRPLPGSLLCFAVAAPWHILAGLRNRGGENGHGFFWFYFVNEHILRFLGRRSPPDYNKLPGLLYWTLHLVWLFPWSFFAPVAAVFFWRHRSFWFRDARSQPQSLAQRSVRLLLIFSTLVLCFFSLSTNQEYYTFPVYLPLLVLIAVALVAQHDQAQNTPGWLREQRLLLLCHGALFAVGLTCAVALASALWLSRSLPASSNVGDLLVHRGVGSYTLSMSHFFDLTTAAFSGLRLPASIACVALALGPGLSLLLQLHRRMTSSLIALALMSTAFLVAAHIALDRFAPLLSSESFAAKIEQLRAVKAVGPDTEVMIFGDQAFGSSIPFYLQQHVALVDGRSTSMLFGSTFPDAPPIFVTHQQLVSHWGQGARKLLFVPLEQRDAVDRLFGPHALVLYESAGKVLLTDRPLASQPLASQSLAVDTGAPLPKQ